MSDLVKDMHVNTSMKLGTCVARLSSAIWTMEYHGKHLERLAKLKEPEDKDMLFHARSLLKEASDTKERLSEL